MPKASRDVQSALTSKGFRKVEEKTHHRFFSYFSQQGKMTKILTKVSHSGKDITDPLLSAMASQCRLTNRQFRELIECPLNRNGYESILAEKGLL